MQNFLLQAMSSEPRFTRLQALAWLAQVLESLSALLLIPYGEALLPTRLLGWPKWTRTTDLVLIRHAL